MTSYNSINFMYLCTLQFKYSQRHSLICYILLTPVEFKEYYQRYSIYHQRKDYFLKMIGLYLRKTVASFSRRLFICSVDLFPILSNSEAEWDRSACFFSVISTGVVFASNYREIWIWGLIC